MSEKTDTATRAEQLAKLREVICAGAGTSVSLVLIDLLILSMLTQMTDWLVVALAAAGVTIGCALSVWHLTHSVLKYLEVLHDPK